MMHLNNRKTKCGMLDILMFNIFNYVAKGEGLSDSDY